MVIEYDDDNYDYNNNQFNCLNDDEKIFSSTLSSKLTQMANEEYGNMQVKILKEIWTFCYEFHDILINSHNVEFHNLSLCIHKKLDELIEHPYLREDNDYIFLHNRLKNVI